MYSKNNDLTYRWYIMALSAFTNALVVAAPSMSISVLFHEISTELQLNLVQVGVVWGIGALPGMLTGLLAGAVGDRFGPKHVLLTGCLLAGLAGATRGLAQGFVSLTAAVFLFGALVPLVIMNGLKLCSIWFPRGQLGLANGILSMGMALGFLLGSLFSATWLSPWLGGWRHVLFFYGAIAMMLAIPWYFTRPAPSDSPHETTSVSMRQAVFHVVRIRNVWLLGLAGLGITGSVQGTLGYLPLYLRQQGWLASGADGALAFFHTTSMVFVLPIALWSDKLGSRRRVLLGAALLIAVGVGLLSILDGASVWMAVGMAGLARDGFMAIFMTMVLESEGVGSVYAGTASGLIMVLLGVGSLSAPPLGNSLATIGAGIPFLFWASLTMLGIFVLLLIPERRGKTAANQLPARI